MRAVTSSMFLRPCAGFFTHDAVLAKAKMFPEQMPEDGLTAGHKGSSLYVLPKCLPLNSQQSQETLRMTLTFASHKMHFTLILEP